MPKISVILPVYNVEPYIERCINSILSQTYKDFELIIVESASTDKSSEICDSYAKKDKRITVIHEGKRTGLSQGRNIGIDWAFKNSDSEWIAFIDSDDWIHKRYFELLLSAAMENNAEVSACGWKPVSEYKPDCIIDSYSTVTGTEEQLVQSNTFSEFNITAVWAKIYKKYLFKNIRFPVGKHHEDLYVTYRVLFPLNNIALVKADLYFYFENDNGLTRSDVSLQKIIDDLDGYEQQIKFFYENKSKVLFQIAFTLYVKFVCVYYLPVDRKNDFEILNELKAREKKIKAFIREYSEYIPDPAKKYGHRNWINEKYLKKQDFKNDFSAVRAEKGVLYSVLWAIKAKIKDNR